MTERTVIGLEPWLPWPLSRWPWWAQPVRAERLAALRIGVASVLLVDLLTTYLPHAGAFFGADSLGSPEVFPATACDWSLLRGVTDQRVVLTALGVWLVATAALLVGLATRVAAVAVWVLSVSFAHINPGIENAGDEVRGIILFYLMLCPCGAVSSFDHRLRQRRGPGPVHVWPWPLHLLLIQMALIYFTSGVHKLFGEQWRSGESLYFVLSNWTVARWPFASVALPFALAQLLTWTVLAWELTFPLLIAFRWTRMVALGFGVAFHLGIALFLELGMFTPYMLCLYLPLIHWEGKRKEPAAQAAGPVC